MKYDDLKNKIITLIDSDVAKKVAEDYFQQFESDSDLVFGNGRDRKKAYAISKDYERLYEMIIGGFVAVGFAEKDICRIRKQEDVISISCRGICYGSVTSYDVRYSDRNEKALFVELCKSLDLEYIQTHA